MARPAALSALLATLAVGAPGLAWAQCATSSDERVCGLLRQGDELHRGAPEGRAGIEAHAAALERYREAARRMGAAMHHAVAGRIAQELVETGQYDEALLATQECLAQAESDMENPAQTAQECRSTRDPRRQRTCQTWTVCRLLADDLATRRSVDGTSVRYGSVRVEVVTPPAGTHVFVAGNDLPLSVGSVGFPVVPGTVLVEVEATGFRRFSQAVRVGAGETVRVPVTLEAPARNGPSTEEDDLSMRAAREVLQAVTDLHRGIDLRFQSSPTDRCLATGLDDLDGVLLRVRSHYGRVRGAQLSRNSVRFREEMERLRGAQVDAHDAVSRTERCPSARSASVAASTAPPQGATGVVEASRRRVSTLTIVTLSAGGVSLVASAVLFAARASVISDLDGMCLGDRSQCPASASDLRDEGAAINSAGNVTLLTGAALSLAGGVSLLIDLLRSRPASTRVAAWLMPNGLGLGGRF